MAVVLDTLACSNIWRHGEDGPPPAVALAREGGRHPLSGWFPRCAACLDQPGIAADPAIQLVYLAGQRHDQRPAVPDPADQPAT